MKTEEHLFQNITHQKLKQKTLIGYLMEKNFFDVPVENKEKKFEKTIEIGKNND